MFLLRALTSPRSPFCPQAYGGCLRVASGGIQRRDGETQRGAAAGAEANYEIYRYDLMRFYSVMKNRASYTLEIVKIFFSFFYRFGYHFIYLFFIYVFIHFF